jgi:predicted ATP-grasp superfamily ATP-dependent carboligase
VTSTRRVLVLDAHTTQALACVRSLATAGYVVFVASPRRWPLASWSRYSREQYHLGDESVGEFAALRDWAKARGISAVLPLTERSCVLCNAERSEWERNGMTVGCETGDALLSTFDKARTAALAAECGVAIPRTYVPTSLEECHAAARELGLPCVVKSRFSHYWTGTSFVEGGGTSYASHESDLDRMCRVHRQGDVWPLVQGFVDGTGKGLFTVCDRGRPLMWFAHERLRDVRPSGSGSSLRRSIPVDPRMLEPAERLLQSMRWHGPAMVEFRDTGAGAPCLMEINGRFWGSLELAVRAGADFPRMWTDLLCDRAPSMAETATTGTTVRWLWGDVKRLLYILAGRPRGYPGSYPTRLEGLAELFGAQPPGTELEAWRADDRWPAVGEWVQGVGELAAETLRSLRKRAARRSGTARVGLPVKAESLGRSPALAVGTRPRT